MREKVLRYIRDSEMMRAGDRVCAAVSGGADSVALLRVLLELRAQLGIVLSATHFNHQLRGDASHGDETFVADLAREHGLELFAGRGDVREHASQNKLTLEASARDLRYGWFRELAAAEGLDAIATGHTLDDQAETVLMKFLRGAGTRGLAGIYPELVLGAGAERPGALTEQPTAMHKGVPRQGIETRAAGEAVATRRSARVVRPLVSISRAEILIYLAGLGQSWREDDSNLDSSFLRNRVRHEMLPTLERDYNHNLRQVLSETAEVARAEEEYWQGVIQPELLSRTTTPSVLTLHDFAGLPLALRRRLLKQFAQRQGLTVDFEHIENLLRCSMGEIARTELPAGWTAVREGESLSLRPPPRKIHSDAALSYQYILAVPGEVAIPEIGRSLRAVLVSPNCAEQAEPGSLLAADLFPGALTVRNWQPGDRYLPAYSGSEQKLKRLFSEKNIPEERRATWPVVLKDDEIVWVRGFPVGRSCEWKGRGGGLLIEEVQ